MPTPCLCRPRSRPCRSRCGAWRRCRGGDVYELCFTAAPGSRARVIAAAAAAGVPVTRIGQITAAPGLRLVDASGDPIDPLPHGGYDHFA